MFIEHYSVASVDESPSVNRTILYQTKFLKYAHRVRIHTSLVAQCVDALAIHQLTD